MTALRSLRKIRRGNDFVAWLRDIAQDKVYHHFRHSSRRIRTLERFREGVAEVAGGQLGWIMAVERP